MPAPTTVVHAGDHVDFTPAVPGADCRMCAGELAQLLHTPSLTINGAAAHPEDPVPAGAVIVKTGQQRAVPAAAPAALDGYPQRCPAVSASQAGRSPLLSHGPSGTLRH